MEIANDVIIRVMFVAVDYQRRWVIAKVWRMLVLLCNI